MIDSRSCVCSTIVESSCSLSCVITSHFQCIYRSRMVIFLVIFLLSTMISLICGGSSVIWLMHQSQRQKWLLFIQKQVKIQLLIYIHMSHQGFDRRYELYQISDRQSGYKIDKAPLELLNSGEHSYRKAYQLPYRFNENKALFVDDLFRVEIDQDDKNAKGQSYSLRRIYELYDRQLDLWDEELMVDVPIKKQQFYPTFTSEFSMIDKNYIQTRFFTKKINGRGFYMYFIRRNGQYHVEFMDDIIPVDPETKLPLWGMSVREPWKLVLMKAWLKEKKTISALVSAEPYEFIDAFGFPGYRAISIQKEINHIAVSHLTNKAKEDKEKRIPLDIPGFIVVGKTRNLQQVEDLGLMPNRAGYRILRTHFQNKSVLKSEVRGMNSGSNKEIDKKGEDNLYKVHSSLPSYWVGEYSLFAKSKVQDEQCKAMQKDIQNVHNEFLASYFQISRVFNKFYICPEYSSQKFMGNILEDSLSVDVGADDSVYYFEIKVCKGGFMNLNIELPLESSEYKIEEGKSAPRYSYIKYMMARKKSKERRQQLLGYDYYDGEYVKGYHKSVNRFIQVQKGTYYVYFKLQKNKAIKQEHKISININTNAGIDSFKQVDHRNPKYDFSFVIRSALHSYNKRFGVKTYVGKDAKEKKQLVVHISHSFDEIGFAMISIMTLDPSQTFLAMNAFQSVFAENRLTVCRDLHELNDDDESVINMAAKVNEANVLVIERTIKMKQADEKFPPPGSVDFYHII